MPSEEISQMSSLVVDFAKEKEAGYQRIFQRSPLLSSAAVQWDGLLIAYDQFLPGRTPELASKQHGIGIFLDLPEPAPAERILDGKRQQESVRQGDFVLVPAQVWQQTFSDRRAGALVLSFEPGAIAQTLETSHIELIPHFATSDPLVHQIGLALKRALEERNRLYAETMTTALIAHLAQYYSAQTFGLPNYSGLAKAQLQRVVEYIQAYLERDLSLKELAAIAQLSPHYFSQRFKQSTGLSPHQYVIRCRVKRAQELLKQSELSLAEISEIVGFVDQSHLNRHFKQLLGVTPRAFRQSLN
jgi:AraC family transcriptional regulator